MARDNHQDVVQRLHDAQPPEHTAESVLALAVRVVAALPRDERAGLLRKDAGENIAPFHGVMCSAGRICYPDGQIYKIATDIPATNAPVWNDDGTVDPARYFDISPFIETAPEQPPAPATPEPPAPAEPDDEAVFFAKLDEIVAAGDRILEGLTSTRDALNGLTAKIQELENKGIITHMHF